MTSKHADSPPSKPNQVLSDHKRQGSRFIPPFVNQFGDSLHHLSWTELVLPELLWIALVHDHLGHRSGVQSMRELMRCRLTAQSSQTPWLASASAFGTLVRNQKAALLRALDPSLRTGIVSALGPLLRLYPKCPMAFLATRVGAKTKRPDDLSTMRRIVSCLCDKADRVTVLTMATFVYLAFESGHFKVHPDSGLKDLSLVEDYPQTEESKAVAPLVRASVQALFGSTPDQTTTWPEYFWNRGLQIDKCILEDAE